MAQTMTMQIGKHAVPVEANEAGYDHEGETFLVYTPQTHCCNCGQRQELHTIDTHFVEEVDAAYNKQRQLYLALPYCTPCGNRANKYPPSDVFKVVIGFVLWMGLTMGFVMSSPLESPMFVRISGLVLPLAVVIGLFYFLGRPKAPMTSTYTPVRIKQYSGRPGAVRTAGSTGMFMALVHVLAKLLTRLVTGKDPNATGKLNFRFSNPTYAKAFAMVNEERVKGGSIVIR